MKNNQNQQGSAHVVVVSCLVPMVIAVMGWMFWQNHSNYQILRAGIEAAEFGFDESYKQTQLHCPTNVELELVCLRSFYSEKDPVEIEETAVRELSNNGYELEKIVGGYDGPDQIAYRASSEDRKVKLIFVIIKTNNTAYKKAMGNVRIESRILH